MKNVIEKQENINRFFENIVTQDHYWLVEGMMQKNNLFLKKLRA